MQVSTVVRQALGFCWDKIMTEKQTSVNLTNRKSDVQYMLVDPANLGKAWSFAVPLLEKGQEYLSEHFSLQDIYNAVQSGRIHLWFMNNAEEVFYLILTEFVDYPQKRVLHIIYQGGTRMRDALQFLDCVEHWAWKNGAVGVEVVGRKAVGRVLKPFGYEEPGVYLTKSFSYIKEH